MSDFVRDGDHVVWLCSTGPVRLPEKAAEGLLAIFHEEHDALLREGDRLHARPLRKMALDLGDALEAGKVTGIPRLRPITVQVRQMNPALWGDAA